MNVKMNSSDLSGDAMLAIIRPLIDRMRREGNCEAWIADELGSLRVCDLDVFGRCVSFDVEVSFDEDVPRAGSRFPGQSRRGCGSGFGGSGFSGAVSAVPVPGRAGEAGSWTGQFASHTRADGRLNGQVRVGTESTERQHGRSGVSRRRTHP